MGLTHDKMAVLETALAELDGLRVRVNIGLKGVLIESYLEHSLTVKINNHHLEFHSAVIEEYEYICERISTAAGLARDIREAFKTDWDRQEEMEQLISEKLSGRTHMNFKLYLGSVEEYSIKYFEDKIASVKINGLLITVNRGQKHNSNDRFSKDGKN